MELVALYREVLPAASRLGALDASEQYATVELLCVLLASGEADAERAPMASRVPSACIDLLSGGDVVQRRTLGAHFDLTRQRLFAGDDTPDELSESAVASTCGRLTSPATRYHVMCLLIVSGLLVGDGRSRGAVCRRIGRHFQMDEAGLDELVDSLRRSMRSAIAERESAGDATHS